jgi:hypothetical protein
MAEFSTRHELAARQIVDAAFAVHDTLGPRVLRAVDRQCSIGEPAAGAIALLWRIGLPGQVRHDRIDPGMDGIMAGWSSWPKRHCQYQSGLA